MPTPSHYIDASVVHIYDHDEQDSEEDQLLDELVRFGPEAVGVKTILLPGFLPATKNSRSSHRRTATYSTATASLTSSECDAEESENAIELSVIHSLAPGTDTSGSQSSVGTTFAHTRTTSASAFSSFSSSSSSRSASECECVHEEEIGTGSAHRANLNRNESVPAHDASEDVRRREDEIKVLSALSLGEGEAGHSSSSQTPMSPSQKPYTHRIYVPFESHHDKDRKRVEANDEAGLQSQASCYHQSADSDHLSPGETDTLLPVRTNDCLATLPLPATTARGDETVVFKFSFSSIETSLHVAGISVTTFLIVFSIWLTLANVMM